VLFYFASEERIDFRDLVKDLSSRLHARIEMRQIGVRDEAKMVGGIGSCGRELCCSTFLPAFQPVSIKMAKDQGLVLNPSKVSGQCGRLKCCLVYEQDLYKEMKKTLPKVGKRVSTPAGDGKVVELDVLRQRVRVWFDEGGSETFPGEVITLLAPTTPPPRAGKPPRPVGQTTMTTMTTTTMATVTTPSAAADELDAESEPAESEPAEGAIQPSPQPPLRDDPGDPDDPV
jgi:hypothetical protein